MTQGDSLRQDPVSRELEARTKELACIHSLAEAIRTGGTLHEVCEQIVPLIPQAWSNPEMARARIILDDRAYVSAPFEDTPWGQSSAIIANGWARGMVQVFYIQPVKEHGGTFLPEERRLLDTVARWLGEALQRREAEAELRARSLSLAQERNRFEAVLRGVGEGVVVTDNANQILLMNRAAQVLLGILHSEPVGADFLKLIDDEPFLDMWRETARQGRDFNKQELKVTKPAPRALWVTRSRIADLMEGRHGYVTILHDVTKEREIDQMKTDFVSAVSHELRTPLTSIKGFASTLRDNSDVPADLQKRFLSIINEESDRLTTLIEDLLIMARIESGRLSKGRHPVDLVKILDQVAESLDAEMVRKSLRLWRDVPEGLAKPLGDNEKLRIVLVNLLENAVKFTPEGGSIFVHASSDANEVKLEVEDTGIGIPDTELPRVFDRFYRVRRPGRQEPGTGLGLFIAKEMVLLHGGHVDVRSAVGQGSVFTVYLPLAGNADYSD